MDHLTQGSGHHYLYKVHENTSQVEAVGLKEGVGLFGIAMQRLLDERDILDITGRTRLVKDLRRLPLAILLAAADIRADVEAGVDEQGAISRYVTGLRHIHSRAQSETSDQFGCLSKHEKTIWTVWEKCLGSSDVAVWPCELLCLLAQFRKGPIQRDFFRLASLGLRAACAQTRIPAPSWLLQTLSVSDGGWDDRSFRATIRCLLHGRLMIEQNNGEGGLDLNSTARFYASHTEHRRYYQQLHLLVVTAACLRAMEEERSIESRAQLHSHLPTSSEITSVEGITAASTASVCTAVGKVWMDESQWQEARPLFATALKERRRLFGKEHEASLENQALLASALQSGGDYEKAKMYFEEVLSLRKKNLGSQHPDVLTSEADLASVLQDLGEDKAAARMYRRVLKKREDEQEEDDLETLVVVGDLASVLQGQGDYSTAVSMYRRALAGSKKLLGDRHRDTIVCANNLASALSDDADHRAAEKMFLWVLEAYRHMLPTDHPDVLTTRSNLALAVYSQGRYEEAEGEYRSVADELVRVLGERHPSTLLCNHNLGRTLHSLHKYEEAEAKYRSVLHGYEGTFEDEHPHVLETVGKLVAMLEEQEKHDALEELCTRYPEFVPES